MTSATAVKALRQALSKGPSAVAERALGLCRGLPQTPAVLNLGFTEAGWLKENPPPEVKASFDLDYPTMGRVPDLLAAIARTGFSLLGHFTLPDEAWWDDFYAPMERRIEELRAMFAWDAEALDRFAEEPEMHRRHSAGFDVPATLPGHASRPARPTPRTHNHAERAGP